MFRFHVSAARHSRDVARACALPWAASPLSRQNRLLVALILSLSLAGCGTRSATKPTSHPAPTAWHDPQSGLTIAVGQQIYRKTYALLLVTMRNTGGATYGASPGLEWTDTAVASPGSPGTTSACDADFSHGTGLDYQSLPPRSVHTGWIRCDYPAGTYGIVLSWEGSVIGNYVAGG